MATTGASLGPIYSRLNSAPQHHPMNANTFSDWSMEAGDTIKMSRGDQEYSTPIHSSSMTWRGGAPVVKVNSTGNEKRDPLAKVSKRKYSGGGGGMGNDQGLYSDVWSDDGVVHSLIEQTAASIRSEVELAALGLHSEIEQTAISIKAEVSNELLGLSGKIEVEAGKITQIVTAVGANGEVTAASIVLAINQSSGKSEAKINAERVYIGGQKSTTIINGKLDANAVTAEWMQSKVSLINNVHVKSLTVGASGSIHFESGDGATLTGSKVPDIITNLRIQSDGNLAKLQKVTVGNASWTDVGSFSRAISSWTWGGGNGKVNVTALPQNQSQSVKVSIGGPLTIRSPGTYVYKVYYENSSGDDVETGASMTVTVDI